MAQDRRKGPGRDSRLAEPQAEVEAPKPLHGLFEGRPMLAQRKLARRAQQRRLGDETETAPEAATAQPLPGGAREKFERSLGADLGGVRVHTGGDVAREATGLEARAYTVGNDIGFAQGEYQPGSADGERLLAHEVAHTVQQSKSQAHPQRKAGVSEPHDASEAEADDAAEQMVRGAPATVGPAGAQVARKDHKDKGKDKAKTPAFQPVVKNDAFLQESESDTTIVGLQYKKQWMVAVASGKPASFAAASVGTYSGSKSASVVEMRAAKSGDKGWTLDGKSVGVLVSGDGEGAVALGEIAIKDGGHWKVHGKHGSKDVLPADVAAFVKENDQLELGPLYVWMSYPTGADSANPGGWTSSGHDKKQVNSRVATFKKDAEKMPEPLRSQILAHVETMAVVSSVEGSYDATSGQVADTSGSLGVFQWARPRNPEAGADSIDHFFVTMKQRADSGAAKQAKKIDPLPEELIAMEAWEQAQSLGIGVDKGHTTITHGTTTKKAGGLDLELAAAGSTGLDDSNQVAGALRQARNFETNWKKEAKKQPKIESADDKKMDEANFLDNVIQQLATAAKDVAGSDLADDKTKPLLLAEVTKLEAEKKKTDDAAKARADAKAAADAAKSGDATKKAADPPKPPDLDQLIKDKIALVKEADHLVRPIIDHKIAKASGMETDAMKQYQLVAANDWIKDMLAKSVYPAYDNFFQALLPDSSVSTSSAKLVVGERTLHVAGGGAKLVGDFLKAEKSIASLTMLGVNRPAYVATALWKALQSSDVATEAQTLAAGIWKLVDAVDGASASAAGADKEDEKKKHGHKKKAEGKRKELREADLTAMIGSASPDLKDQVSAAQKALASLKGVFWPQTTELDEAALLVKFRQEAMRIYGTVEQGDADSNNRVGRFVTVEMIDWAAVDAAKAKAK
jgi:hypothetical protein